MKRSRYVMASAVLAGLCILASVAFMHREEPPLWDLIPALFWDDSLYYLESHEIKYEDDLSDAVLLGYVTSTVDGSEFPDKNGQSNRPIQGAPVKQLGEKIFVLTDDSWILLLREPSLWNLPPSLLWNDCLYFYTGLEIKEDVSDAALLGEVTSTVDRIDIPNQNGQANMAIQGAPVKQYGESIIVLIHDSWIEFELREEEANQ